MKLNIPDNIAAITPYPPGKPIDELEREYGITGSIKLASNENPWGPSPAVVNALQEELSGLNRYPDGSCYYLTKAIARKLGVDPAEIILGNGSNEVIEFLVKAFVREGDEVVTSHPSFLMYQKIVQVRGGVNRVVPLSGMKHDLEVIYDTISEKTRLVFLDNPNNPTGTVIDPVHLREFLSKVPESVIVVLDEAYVDYMDEASRIIPQTLVRHRKGCCPVVLLRTFSKAYGLPGLRVGYGVMNTEVAACLHKVRQPFNVNRMAQVGALAALEDEALQSLFDLAHELGMDVLMEVHDEQEMRRALKTGARLIGINNRNLRNFDTSLETTLSMQGMVGENHILVTESGIHTKDDVQLMRDNGVNAFLVGEAFMRADDPGEKLAELFF